MNEADHQAITLAIDVKKSRLRLYKSVLHELGDPSLVRLMFNPVSRIILIRAVDRTTPLDGHEIKVLMNKPGGSFEIYSKSLIREMRTVDSSLRIGYTYRLQGRVFPAKREAIFSMDTMMRVTEGYDDDVS